MASRAPSIALEYKSQLHMCGGGEHSTSTAAQNVPKTLISSTTMKHTDRAAILLIRSPGGLPAFPSPPPPIADFSQVHKAGMCRAALTTGKEIREARGEHLVVAVLPAPLRLSPERSRTWLPVGHPVMPMPPPPPRPIPRNPGRDGRMQNAIRLRGHAVRPTLE